MVFGEHLETKENHFAGSDSERASDFQWALDQPNIKAIWCAILFLTDRHMIHDVERLFAVTIGFF